MGGVSRDMTFGAFGVFREALEALAVSAIAVTGLGDRSLGRRRFLLWPSYLRSCGLGSARAWGFGHWPGVRGVWIGVEDLRQAPVLGSCLAFSQAYCPIKDMASLGLPDVHGGLPLEGRTATQCSAVLWCCRFYAAGSVAAGSSHVADWLFGWSSSPRLTYRGL